MRRSVCFLVVAGALVAVTAGFLTGQDRATRAEDAKRGAEAAEPKRKSDEEAIRKLSAELTAALEKGDAAALAALWTEEGEYVGEDGTTIRGRAALEAAYAKFFAKSADIKPEITIDGIRFVSRDNAIEEGVAKVRKGKGTEATTSRYSALWVRENARWKIAVLREWPDEGVTLRDLDWLVGTWVAKTDGTDIRTTYEWDDNKMFLKVRITIKDKDSTVTATQTIARDPRTGGLRSWLFGSDGGFGESSWTRDGKRWLIEASGVTTDGGEMTASNILMPLDKDSFTWQSIDRTLDGAELANIPPVKVTRV
jgi:uncharacterized protein (TIGR02246 family)